MDRRTVSTEFRELSGKNAATIFSPEGHVCRGRYRKRSGFEALVLSSPNGVRDVVDTTEVLYLVTFYTETGRRDVAYTNY